MAKTELEKQKEKQAEEEYDKRVRKIIDESNFLQWVFSICFVIILALIVIVITGN